MTVRCPTCDRPLDLPHRDDGDSDFDILQSLTSVSCPNCGLVSLTQASEETVSFHQPRLDLTSSRIDHFVLVRRLGQGSFGDVWLADDVDLGRHVALKLPRSHGREMTSLMFEAKTAASLRHPNIVSIFEVGNAGEQVFIASEYIDGMTLRDLLTAGKPTITRTIDLVTAIARALHYAHQQGVVHRDVKPANILINKEGQPFVTDFGIAKRINAEATISSEGQIIGTARYMSPEQASGKTRETDPRADIYALGVIFFEMLTRDVPYRGNVRALLHQKIYEDAPSPRTLDRSLPKDLETICLKCLERDPAKRFSSALELAEELGRFSSGEPIRSRPISRLERTWRWCQRRPAIAGLLSGLFLSLTLGLIGVSFFWRQAVQNARQAEENAQQAKSNELQAERNALQAEQNAQRAEQNAQRAERNAAETRQSLYRSWMNLTSVHLNYGDNAGVKEMLARIANDPQMADFRGFEWNYYDAVTAPMKLVASTNDVVQDVAVSHDGELCASVGPTGDIDVWDSRTGKLERSLSPTAESTASIAFSPASLLLAAGSIDGNVRIWNLGQDSPQLPPIHHGKPVQLVRFAPDGKHLLSAVKLGAVRVWDTETGKPAAAVPSGMTSEVKDARFIDANRFVVATADGHLRFWDLGDLGDSVTPRSELNTAPELESMAISDDGRLLVTGHFRGPINIIPLDGGPRREKVTIWGRVDDIEFLPGSHTAALVTSDGHTHLFNVDTNLEIHGLNTHSLAFGNLARSEDGKFLVIGSGDGSVTRLALDELPSPGIMWHESAARSVAFLSDGRRLVTATESQGIWIWDLITGKSERLDAGAALPGRRLALQPNGRFLASIDGGTAVTLWDVETRQTVRELPVRPTGAVAVQFSGSGKQLAVASRRGSVLVYRADDWSTMFERPEHDGRANKLLFSGDELLVAVAWDTGEVELLDAATGQLAMPTITLTAEPIALEFCPAQGVLAIGTGVGEILLWDLKLQRTRTVIKGHTGRINALASLPDGRTLVSAGRDRALKLWDMPSGELITPLTGHLRQVFTIAVSPDGKSLASGGLEGDVRVWLTHK